MSSSILPSDDEILLTAEEKDVLLSAHRWLTLFSNAIRESPLAVIPAPKGTKYEAWLTLKMWLLLWGLSDGYPVPLVNAQTTPPERERVRELIQRLEEAAPGSVQPVAGDTEASGSSLLVAGNNETSSTTGNARSRRNQRRINIQRTIY